MKKASSGELARGIASNGSIEIMPYQSKEVMIGMHQVNVYLGQDELMQVIIGCIKSGRKVWGKDFAVEIIDLLEYYKESQP